MMTGMENHLSGFMGNGLVQNNISDDEFEFGEGVNR